MSVGLFLNMLRHLFLDYALTTAWDGLDNLTHWGWVMLICVNKLTIIGSDNGLLPGQHQAIIWTNGGMMLTGPSGQISIKFYSKFISF